MAQQSDPALAYPADACAGLRSDVRALCEDSARAQQASLEAAERAREARRDVVATRHGHERAILAADPTRRSEAKMAARTAYEKALGAASDEAARTEATATWARALDRANRTARLAQRALAKSRGALAKAEERGRELGRLEQSTRIAAEAAEADCLQARVRLAACEEQAQAGALGAPVGARRNVAVHASMRGVDIGPALIIESLIRGDRPSLDATAALISDDTGLPPARARLHLQELIDGVTAAASEHGFLVFDVEHPFWGQLSDVEAADIVAALTRLGFQFEPAEGWHAGRVPAPADLTMALAYAGIDARSLRHLPGSEELRELPGSITIDAVAYLSTAAPGLSLDSVVGLLGRRAEPLGPLWDEWGQVRPILLSERWIMGDEAPRG